jgi:hypothetical protein
MKMQLVGFETDCPASPRSRNASIKPPPIKAPRPSRRQSRRVVDSQFVEVPIGASDQVRGKERPASPPLWVSP